MQFLNSILWFIVGFIIMSVLLKRNEMSYARDCLKQIAEIIEQVDQRCMAADGPVTPTNEEITIEELRRIYALATGNE